VIFDYEHAHWLSMQQSGDNRVTGTVTSVTPVVSYNVAMLNSRFSIIAPAAAITALAVAGCGGSKKPPVAASNAASHPNNGAQVVYKFAACMRHHGVSNFPDPVVHSGNSHSVTITINPTITGSPAYKSAQTACQGILPPALTPAQQQAQIHYKIEHYVAFAACMRGHGITNFPDPNSQGDLGPQLAQAGINVHLPNVIAAARACVPESGGLLTQAAISQATNS
jgi:hypothetical protein